ncbi:MAG: AmmeMemoRadiSam system protein A [Planctomycetes bacterium]|nr:AmmeMemoRadiSam system protein A [Planctomycetota bacterium]
MELTELQKTKLLDLARGEILYHLGLARSKPKFEPDETLEISCGAFVTVKTLDDELRGCLGIVTAREPIYKVVAEMSVASCIRDSRFPPVRPEEATILDVEISVMTPPESVKSIDEIVVGRDGLVVRDGFRSGLLLPQVASSRDMDAETFLGHTCLKAGLPWDAWRRAFDFPGSGTEVLKFSAIVFGGPLADDQHQ